MKTFSIGFHEAGYDEARCAKQVAAHLGTDHTEFYVEPRHALDVIPHLPEWFDEPFADSSQIPSYLVSELTRKHVTVALSGDGGDELFAGYNRYLWAQRLAHAGMLIPRPLLRVSASAFRALAPQSWNRVFSLVPAPWRPVLAGDKLHKLATLLEDLAPDAVYRRLVSQWDQPEEIAAGGREPAGPLWDTTIAEDFPDPDHFDPTRRNIAHLTFGGGPHLCLGMHLARMEGTVAINALLDRLPDLRLDPAAPAPHIAGVSFRAPAALPVEFTPA